MWSTQWHTHLPPLVGGSTHYKFGLHPSPTGSSSSGFGSQVLSFCPFLSLQGRNKGDVSNSLLHQEEEEEEQEEEEEEEEERGGERRKRRKRRRRSRSRSRRKRKRRKKRKRKRKRRRRRKRRKRRSREEEEEEEEEEKEEEEEEEKKEDYEYVASPAVHEELLVSWKRKSASDEERISYALLQLTSHSSLHIPHRGDLHELPSLERQRRQIKRDGEDQTTREWRRRGEREGKHQTEILIIGRC